MATQTTIAVVNYSFGTLTTCAVLFLISGAMLCRIRTDP